MNKWVGTFGVALLATAVVEPASATVFLSAQQGAATTTVSDVGQGTPGFASIVGPLGDYNINLAFSAVQPLVPFPFQAFLAGSLTANAPGALVLLASQTDVPIDAASYLFSLIFGSSSAAGAQYSLQVFLDPGNAPFAGTIPLLDTGFQSAASISASALSAAYGPYATVSFTEVFVISGDVGNTDFNAAIAAISVPEPAALAMFGPFALLLGFARGRREAR